MLQPVMVTTGLSHHSAKGLTWVQGEAAGFDREGNHRKMVTSDFTKKTIGKL